MGFLQRGQRDPGETIEMPSGMREMQTFRKLPMQMPKRKKKKGITPLNVPQAGGCLNARGIRTCRMANGKTCSSGPSGWRVWEGGSRLVDGQDQNFLR